MKAPHSTLQRQLLMPLLAWKAKKQRKPLLIDGARQTGKTWLLKNLLGAEFDRMLHLDFLENPGLAEAFADSLAPNDLISNIELQTGQPFNPATDLLILDEIGECPQAVTSLKYFAEQAPGWHVAASGSNIGLLSSFPVGQVEQHNLRPMSFGEFIQASDDAALIQAFETQANTAAAHGRLWDQLTDYYFTGGMPEAVANWFGHSSQGGLERAEAVRKIQQDLIEGYRRDFGKYDKTDAQLIGAVFNSIPAQLSNVVNESVNRFRFKGVHPGKSRYANFESAIDWLHQSRLALKNYPLEGELKPPLPAYRKENMVKLFMFDVGLLNVMLGTSYREIKQQGYEYKGYVAENFVQQELAAMGLEPGYSWHGARAEIEFVFSDDGGQIIPVEVKSGQRTRSKSLQTYVQKYQPRKSFKLTGTRGSDGKGESGSPTVLPLYYLKYLPEWW